MQNNDIDAFGSVLCFVMKNNTLNNFSSILWKSGKGGFKPFRDHMSNTIEAINRMNDQWHLQNSLLHFSVIKPF